MIDRHIILDRLRHMDWLMIAAIGVLMVIGVLFIYSACFRSEEVPVSSLFQKQIVWVLIGAVCCVSMAIVDYRQLRELSWAFYVLAIFFLVLVLLVGTKIYGASRWLNVFGINFQPSEFGKLATIFILARFLSRPGRDLRDPRNTVAALLLVGIPFLLIVKEPDLGTAAVLLPVVFLMLFVAGVPLKTLAFLMVLGSMLLPLGWFVLDDYQKERILVFADPGRDPLGAGWNKIQSEIAVGSGGMTGKGYLNGTQNVLGFLPRTVAPTDFIFSVVAEEMGFLGASLIIALYAAILIAGLRVALRARDRFGRLLSVGIMAMLFSHVFVNIAMTMGFMPVTGLPLPLISYGGSFMVSTMLGLGVVQSVYIRRIRQ